MFAFDLRAVRAALAAIFVVSLGVSILGGCVKTTNFDVAMTTRVERRPAVASNPATGEFFVAYLRDQAHALDPDKLELRVKRFNSDGVPIGGELAPFGEATHNAVGRPDIAYSPNSNLYCIVVAERLIGNDRVLARLLHADGTSASSVSAFFDDNVKRLYEDDGLGASALRVTHNSTLDEFVISFQRTYPDPNMPGAFNSEVVALRIDSGGSPVGGPVILYESGHGGFASHALAHAPVATNPVGGHYLFALGPWGDSGIFKLLDKDLKPIVSTLPFDTGTADGDSGQFDIAFGQIEGEDRFLVVWSDGNNCKWPATSCADTLDQWTGVWGSYLDPSRDSYGPGPDNAPFPISKIAEHQHGRILYMPRVAYSATLGGFIVVWREYPFISDNNDESRTHIRGNRVDYFLSVVPPTGPPTPYNNVVLSQVSGSCPPQATPLIPGTCPSAEDPAYPDVAAISGTAAAVVWEQNPNNPDIRGDVFTAK